MGGEGDDDDDEDDEDDEVGNGNTWIYENWLDILYLNLYIRIND